MSVRKQFIAGAVCPQCNAEDRVRWCKSEEREWLECVACGYEAEEPKAPDYPNEPKDKPVEEKPEVQVVELRMPKKD